MNPNDPVFKHHLNAVIFERHGVTRVRLTKRKTATRKHVAAMNGQALLSVAEYEALLAEAEMRRQRSEYDAFKRYMSNQYSEGLHAAEL